MVERFVVRRVPVFTSRFRSLASGFALTGYAEAGFMLVAPAVQQALRPGKPCPALLHVVGSGLHRVGGLSPPLTPPYVPFMAYGGFQLRVRGVDSVRYSPLVSATRYPFQCAPVVSMLCATSVCPLPRSRSTAFSRSRCSPKSVCLVTHIVS